MDKQVTGFDVICHTVGCTNAEIALTIMGYQDTVVLCGVCNKYITDIVAV